MGCDRTMKLSLRDYFAAKALQGILASHVMILPENRRKLAQVCYQYADAMLQEGQE